MLINLELFALLHALHAHRYKVSDVISSTVILWYKVVYGALIWLNRLATLSTDTTGLLPYLIL